MSSSFDPYHEWLGIAPDEQPVDRYRLLGIRRFESNPNVIDNAAERQLLLLKTRQNGPHADLSQQLMDEVSAARVTLLDQAKKAAYDRALRSSDDAQPASRSTDHFEDLPPLEDLAALENSLPETPPGVSPQISYESVAPSSSLQLRGKRRLKTTRSKSPVLIAFAGAALAGAVLTSLVVLVIVTGQDRITPTEGLPASQNQLSKQPAPSAPPPPPFVIVGSERKSQRPTPPPAPIVSKQTARDPKARYGEVLTNSIGMKLVLIREGEFTMGSPEREQFRTVEELQHRVTLGHAFYVGVCEVTRFQFATVMGATAAHSPSPSDLPVSMVSWDQAVEFCERLSTLPAEKTVGLTYRLPTEAEWEYGCRAGSTTAFSQGDGHERLTSCAWYSENSSGQAQAVGQLTPNAWGIFDMHGNVWEWCLDFYDERGYASLPAHDPTGPLGGSKRVVRGGCFSSGVGDCRSARRKGLLPTNRTQQLGFRVAAVRSADAEHVVDPIGSRPE